MFHRGEQIVIPRVLALHEFTDGVHGHDRETELPTAFGELLIDTTSESALLNFGFIVGGTATHNEPVPFDVNLVGLGISTQVFLNNVGGSGKLTNAIDLVIGTF